MLFFSELSEENRLLISYLAFDSYVYLKFKFIFKTLFYFNSYSSWSI